MVMVKVLNFFFYVQGLYILYGCIIHYLYKNTAVVVRHSNKILKVVVTDLKILKIDVSAKIL